MIRKIHADVLKKNAITHLERRLSKVEKNMNLASKNEKIVTATIETSKRANIEQFRSLLEKQIELRCSYQMFLHKFYDLSARIAKLKG